MKRSIAVLILIATGTIGGLIQGEEKRNILYFLVDDMGFSDAGFNGSKDFHTPNIDTLAAKGGRF